MNQVGRPTQTHLYELTHRAEASWAGPAHLTALDISHMFLIKLIQSLRIFFPPNVSMLSFNRMIGDLNGSYCKDVKIIADFIFL